MTTIDNSMAVAAFCPATPDGDTFIYTEMLDRSKRAGNNSVRLLKTFYHRSVGEFWSQWPTIKALCDMGNVRACTRLAPRSYAKVGATFTRMVVEASLTANWAGMKSLYNRACGTTGPNRKLWLLDVDERVPENDEVADRLGPLLIARIQSRKGEHMIATPFDRARLEVPERIAIHKDNPTNLYIPEGAA
jgi:hypothetical protein